MANIQTKKRYSGQNSTSGLNGQLRFEEGNNRLVLHDGANYRMVIGVLPDGSIGIAISKDGEDVFDAF